MVFVEREGTTTGWKELKIVIHSIVFLSQTTFILGRMNLLSLVYDSHPTSFLSRFNSFSSTVELERV